MFSGAARAAALRTPRAGQWVLSSASHSLARSNVRVGAVSRIAAPAVRPVFGNGFGALGHARLCVGRVANKGGAVRVGAKRFFSDAKEGGEEKAKGLFARYNELLVAAPLTTKAITSMFLTGVGDVMCQVFLEDSPFNFVRFVQFTLLGGVLVGPGLHFWYGFVNKVLPGTQMTMVLGRLAMDQLIWAPAFIATFMSALKVIQGKGDEIAANLTSNVWEALQANWKLWPVAMFINFKFVPMQYQVLFANFISLIWNTYLSYVSNKDTVVTVEEAKSE